MSGVVARRWLRNGALTDAGWLDGEPSERELSAQRACVDSANWTVELAYSQATVDTLRAQLEAAEARAEAAEANAARYEWLRDDKNFEDVMPMINVLNYGQDAYLLDGKELDAAIDAAMARTKEETK